jgi:type II secretory pathway predicted ATPase ExeA
MLYATGKQEGILVITGVPGTGKTSLINHFLDSIHDEKLLAITISGAHITPDVLLESILVQLATQPADLTPPEQLRQIEKHLLVHHTAGKRIFLIIDEAQELHDDSLEIVRRLTNLSAARKPLLMVFLLGHHDLMHRIQSAGMEQIHQRVVAACRLEKLDCHKTRQYIEHRLRAVGWQQQPTFEQDSFQQIHQASDGVPRWINLVCGRLLLHCIVNSQHHLDVENSKEVIRQLCQEGLLPSKSHQLDFSDRELI